MPKRLLSGPSVPAVMEVLEERRLLAWGLASELIGQDKAYVNFPTVDGRGQTIVIIDSGMDTQHPAFNTGSPAKVIGSWNFADNNYDIRDPSGHGTVMASILGSGWRQYQGRWYRGLATGARLLILKVDNGAPTVPDERIKTALRWVGINKEKFNITAVNLAFGDGHYMTKTSLPAYGAELAKLDSMNVFVAAPSGNDGTARGVEYPGADPHAFSVGSVTNKGKISSFTTTGPTLNLLAPGEGIIAATINPANGEHMYWRVTGTSYSTAFAVGAAVLLRQVNPRLTNAQVLSILRQSGRWVADRAGRARYPLINLDAALRLASRQAGAKAAPLAVQAASALTLPRETVFSQTRVHGEVFDRR